jgi:hypothetical protein
MQGWEVRLVENPTVLEARKALSNFVSACEGFKGEVFIAFIGHDTGNP